jgi:hypothetical protein
MWRLLGGWQYGVGGVAGNVGQGGDRDVPAREEGGVQVAHPAHLVLGDVLLHQLVLEDGDLGGSDLVQERSELPAQDLRVFSIVEPPHDGLESLQPVPAVVEKFAHLHLHAQDDGSVGGRP